MVLPIIIIIQFICIYLDGHLLHLEGAVKQCPVLLLLEVKYNYLHVLIIPLQSVKMSDLLTLL